MQRKGRKVNINLYSKLHSIPKLKKNVKSNVVYSIPSIAVVVLLFGVFASIHLGWFVGSGNSVYAAEETIGDSTASMTLDTSDVEVKVVPGEKGYTSKNIRLNVNNVNDYTLTITAPAVLSSNSSTPSTGESTNTTTWGYAYGQSGNVESMTYTNFTGNTQQLEYGNSNVSNSNKTLAIAADFTNTNVEAGHYKGIVELALTVTPKVAITYTLTYNSNSSNSDVANLPSVQQCIAYDNGDCSITISNTIPTRNGYEFLGWADTSNATAAQYATGQSISLSGDKTIYAVWKAKVFNGITTMQEMTAAICNAASVGDSATLIDTRDKTSYDIRKHEDNRCWMKDNLKLTGNRVLNSTDTDVSSDFTLPATLTSLSSSSFSSSVNYNTTAQSYYTSALISTTGVFYNWYAATAGTGNASISSGTAPSSICPKGWKLPTGGSSGGEFSALYTATSGKTSRLRNADYGFDATGYIRNGQRSSDAIGYWWASTTNHNWTNIDWANYVYVNNAGTLTNGYVMGMFEGEDTTPVMRYNGYTVRCIAQTSASSTDW